MKRLIFIYMVIGAGILILLGLFSLRHLNGVEIIDESRTVYIKRNDKGFQLYRNGKPFYIKGAAGDSHFYELANLGGNTIRLYDTINLQLNLDEAEKYGLAVIVDIPIPKYTWINYINEEENRILIQKVKSFVNKYKNHNALLIWNLGNELNYPKVHWKDLLRKSKGKTRFIDTFNELINIIHIEDPNHPVSTSTWNIGIEDYFNFKIFSPEIDLLSYNIFGDTKNFDKKIDRIFYLFGASPYYISELGLDGWWFSESKNTSWKTPIEQSSSKKAEQIKTRYNLIGNDNENCLGSLVFFWGNKYECTYTWFSLFQDEYKSEILIEIENLWGKSNNPSKLIGLDFMLVEGMGAFDNLIFAPNELTNSELKFEVNACDSIRTIWEIYPDVWFHGWNDVKYYSKSLKPPAPIDCFLSIEKNTATFLTPHEEGPYRIFAYVYDKNGYFATTNTPFYVLKANDQN